MLMLGLRNRSQVSQLLVWSKSIHMPTEIQQGFKKTNALNQPMSKKTKYLWIKMTAIIIIIVDSEMEENKHPRDHHLQVTFTDNRCTENQPCGRKNNQRHHMHLHHFLFKLGLLYAKTFSNIFLIQEDKKCRRNSPLFVSVRQLLELYIGHLEKTGSSA